MNNILEYLQKKKIKYGRNKPNLKVGEYWEFEPGKKAIYCGHVNGGNDLYVYNNWEGMTESLVWGSDEDGKLDSATLPESKDGAYLTDYILSNYTKELSATYPSVLDTTLNSLWLRVKQYNDNPSNMYKLFIPSIEELKQIVGVVNEQIKMKICKYRVLSSSSDKPGYFQALNMLTGNIISLPHRYVGPTFACVNIQDFY